MNTIRIGVVLAVSLAPAFAGCESPGPMPTAASPVVPVAPSSPAGLAGPPSNPFPMYAPNTTLSGIVSEVTSNGPVPLEGVRVYCEPCGEQTHTSTYTDAKGFYTFKGIWNTTFAIRVSKDGYVDPPGMELNTIYPQGPGWRDVRIDGDTQFDTQLTRKTN